MLTRAWVFWGGTGRDLAQNWDIDVATELEEYLHEVEQITFSFENGPKDLNFAQGTPRARRKLARMC